MNLGFDFNKRFMNKTYTNHIRCYLRDGLIFYHNFSIDRINISPYTKKPYVKGSHRERKLISELNYKKIYSLVDTLDVILADRVCCFNYKCNYTRNKRLECYK